MLLAFRAENVRSFRGPVELSLLATPLAEEGVPRLVPWREDGRPTRVLPAAGVFGANASGKSNLLRAMHDEVMLGERNRAKGRAVTEILRPDSLLLSAAAAANHPDLLPLWEWFAGNLLLTEAANRPYQWAYTAGMLREEQHRQHVLALLQAADLGITDARVRELDPQMTERIRKAQRILQGREEEAEGKDQELAVSPGCSRRQASAPGCRSVSNWLICVLLPS